ncbi:cation-translocating P-type ATPase [Gracilimonas sp. Q87]|uniref:cation-translocating P-type ATPase n=1 Tax=Gracilimonas sp. Q87 TaxID=3384766 RepID=UPI003983E61A
MSRAADKHNVLVDPENLHTLEVEEVLNRFEVDRNKGLNEQTVKIRREQYGINKLRQHKSRSIWSVFISQFKSIIIGILAVAAAAALIYGEWIEGWAVLVVILINTLIGFITELRAVRAMEALSQIGVVKTRVKREGRVVEVDAEDLVPGDLVVIEGGDIITADLRIINASKLQANESALTGESLPVSKNEMKVKEESVLAERSNMLYKGTAVTRGSGLAVVVGTAMSTELGKISSLVETTEDELTPLEERLDVLGYKLIYVSVGIIIAIVISGIVSGKEIVLMIETGIALAVAAIPEGLPIVATLSLAKGLKTLANKNALVNKLSSVETLGATSVICTDKTGTLTENQMTATQVHLYNRTIDVNGKIDQELTEEGNPLHIEHDGDLRLALQVGVICNNATFEPNSEEANGDPLEIALLELGYKAGLLHSELMKVHPEVREDAFDSTTKMMATWNKIEEGKLRVYIKGAPEAILQNCSTYLKEGDCKELGNDEQDHWSNLNNKLAGEGYRMIALATKMAQDPEGNSYEDLCFIGLVALMDPPREGVKEAIEECRQAGINVVMVTGDQVETARYIANKLKLVEKSNSAVIHGSKLYETDKQTKLNSFVYARIDPKQKLEIIDMYQNENQTVAMTGDGVNDAPALKKADIGIAMGRRGTQVAREAADIVLTDDAFSTIVLAVEQGRIIFNNIRKFVFYLLSCNVSEVAVVGIASFIGLPLPILPLQILFLNLVTDVFPALALGVGEGDKTIMKERPRKSEEPILNRKHWKMIGAYSLIMTAAVLGSFLIGSHWLEVGAEGAVTMSFLTLALSQLWHVFNMREENSRIFINSITKNKWIWAAIVLCLVLLLSAIYVPILSDVLSLIPPSFSMWAIILLMSLIPLVTGQLVLILRKAMR